jgi:tRNA (cmo5U34)-methyltransferase
LRRHGEKIWSQSQVGERVYGYIIQEDTPCPLLFQVDMMLRKGCIYAVILYKNVCYAAFRTVKPGA